jgi:hypothetical protein
MTSDQFIRHGQLETGQIKIGLQKKILAMKNEKLVMAK